MGVSDRPGPYQRGEARRGIGIDEFDALRRARLLIKEGVLKDPSPLQKRLSYTVAACFVG